MVHVAVVGGGAAGLSAALFTRKNGLETTVFDTDATWLHKAHLFNYLGIESEDGTAFTEDAREALDGVIEALAEKNILGGYDLSRRYPELGDALLAGDGVRVARIVGGLRGEGTPEPVVVWAFQREIALLGAAIDTWLNLDRSSNAAVVFVWAGWWAGYTMTTYLVGNTWPALNPWRAMAEAMRSAKHFLPSSALPP